MKRKALMWIFCVLLYAMQIPFIGIVIGIAADPDFSDSVIRAVEIYCVAMCAVVVTLCVAHLIAAVKGDAACCPFAVTMAVKLALIPFFIINFVIWLILWLGTFNLFLIWFAPAVWLISLSSTYIFMLGGGAWNIVYLIRLFMREKKCRYLLYAVMHFIYVADVVAAVLAYSDGKHERVEMSAGEV